MSSWFSIESAWNKLDILLVVPKGSELTEHIIIGTPGKVMDWALKYRHFNLEDIIVFVLDEADVMIDQQGHQDQCIRIHKYVEFLCKTEGLK